MAQRYTQQIQQNRVAQDLFQTIMETLAKDKRAAHRLTQEVVQLIPESKDRQIYKLIYPFVYHSCFPQATFLIKQHVIKPALDDKFRLFKSPNQYSMLLMSYGKEFFIDQQKQAQEENQDQAQVKNDDQQEQRQHRRFSLYRSLQDEIKHNPEHLEYIRNIEAEDAEKLIFLLYTMVLNNSRYFEQIDILLESLKRIVTESLLLELPSNRSGTIVKILSVFMPQSQVQGLEDLEKMSRQIFISQNKKKTFNNEGGETGQTVSKENLFVRDALKEILGSENDFKEELFLEDALLQPDFYIPSAKLCIEINGRNKFYPFTQKYNNFTGLKHKMILQNGHNVMYLNSWKLEGMINNPDGKTNLKELLTKTLHTYQNKVSQQESGGEIPLTQNQE
ncbi:UNKNOWN [Stylonychia lemnae]|uniref:RAP domain-containing protein n=1 Tax=Stylonychia lemnae TaxID=5949 RepID=A0A078AEU1_STYLE|nr:UNKNOWN [Stylonychia lemnae]|eukprot:CDW79398.1 UNKNOWN [Stylonychia lemnae]